MRMTIGMLRQIIKEEVSVLRDFKSTPHRRSLRESTARENWGKLDLGKHDQSSIRSTLMNVSLEAQQVNTVDNIELIQYLKQILQKYQNNIPKEDQNFYEGVKKRVDDLEKNWYDEQDKRSKARPLFGRRES